VWDAETGDLYDKYGPVSGTGSAQQLKRKNDQAWRGFFETLTKYRDGELDEKPAPPGYRGNRNDGHDLQGYVRNDQYSFTWRNDGSTVEFTIGKNLSEKYGMTGQKLRLDVHGDPRWTGEDSGLEIAFDENSDCFRVNWTVNPQPDDVETVQQSMFTHTLDSSNTKHAAIDLGANNTLTILTEDGDAAVFHARPEFEWFKQSRERIDEEKSRLPDGTYSSRRIRRLYDRLYGRRDHHRDAAVKHAAEWLLGRNVGRVFVGDLSGVLSTHWSARVNEKTHAFWSYGQLTDRIEATFEVAAISVSFVDEWDTSSTCPHCESADVSRSGDELSCGDCGVVVHSDVAGAGNILMENSDVDVSSCFRPMARPAGLPPERDRRVHVTHLEWNDHEWTPLVEGTLGSFDQRGFSESVRSTLAPTGCGDYGRFPRL